MKKKVFGIICMLTLLLGLTACGKKKEEIKTPENNNQENNEVVLGGWNVNLDAKSIVSEDELKLFNKAKEEYDGVELEPIALLATQVVSGKNYMFLCKGTTVTLEPKTSYKIVVVYNDLEGNAEITNVTDFDVKEYLKRESNPSGDKVVGGWEANKDVEKGKLDSDSANAFKKATEELTGASYTPIATIATQVVSGKNYAVLALEKVISAEPVYKISLVTIYEDLNKNAEILSIENIDLGKYNK